MKPLKRIINEFYDHIKAIISVELLNKVGIIATDLAEFNEYSLRSAMPNSSNHKIA